MSKKKMLHPCRCSECDNSDTNECGIVCMVLYPQFTEDGECEAFEPLEGGVDCEN